MNFDLKSVWPDLQYFIGNSDLTDPLYYLFIFLPLPLWWLLTKVFLLSAKDRRRDPKLPASREYTIQYCRVAAGCCTAFLIILGICYFWSEGYYNSNPLTFSHLLALLVAYLIIGAAMRAGASLFAKATVGRLIFQPLNEEDERNRTVLLKREFAKRKLWLVLPFVGFLALLMLNLKSQNLVTIVLDNSSSMETNNANGIVPIEVGRKALFKTVENLDGYTDLIIATFAESDNYISDAGELAGKQTAQELTGNVRFFDAADNNNARSYINTLNNVITPSSPLTETIYKSYLFAKEYSANKSYGNSAMIIITDGGEAKLGDFTDLFCDDANFTAVFPDPENISLINLEDDATGDFYNKAADCGYTMQEGSDLTAYNESLDMLMQDYKNNWSVIFWTMIIALVSSLFIYFTEPKRN